MLTSARRYQHVIKTWILIDILVIILLKVLMFPNEIITYRALETSSGFPQITERKIQGLLDNPPGLIPSNSRTWHSIVCDMTILIFILAQNVYIQALSVTRVCLCLQTLSIDFFFSTSISQTFKCFKDPWEPCIILLIWDVWSSSPHQTPSNKLVCVSLCRNTHPTSPPSEESGYL